MNLPWSLGSQSPDGSSATGGEFMVIKLVSSVLHAGKQGPPPPPTSYRTPTSFALLRWGGVAVGRTPSCPDLHEPAWHEQVGTSLRGGSEILVLHIHFQVSFVSRSHTECIIVAGMTYPWYPVVSIKVQVQPIMQACYLFLSAILQCAVWFTPGITKLTVLLSHQLEPLHLSDVFVEVNGSFHGSSRSLHRSLRKLLRASTSLDELDKYHTLTQTLRSFHEVVRTSTEASIYFHIFPRTLPYT